MTKYRKKPVEIEAVQMPSKWGDFNSAPQWLLDAMEEKKIQYIGDETFSVATLEGDMIGETGSYIVRGVEGEIYPVKRSIFEKTYDRVA